MVAQLMPCMVNEIADTFACPILMTSESSPRKNPGKRKFDTLFERVMAKVVILEWQIESNACWLFTGSLDKDGYGYISRRIPGLRTPRQRRVHIITWEHLNGPLPAGFTLDHLDCIAKACCNPDHVELVTRVKNSQRRWNPVYARA